MPTIYDGSSAELERILQLHAAGETIVCASCGTPLLIATTHEEATRLSVHPGVFCPINVKHVAILRTLRYPNEPSSQHRDPPGTSTAENADEEWFQRYRRSKGWDNDRAQ